MSRGLQQSAVGLGGHVARHAAQGHVHETRAARRQWCCCELPLGPSILQGKVLHLYSIETVHIFRSSVVRLLLGNIVYGIQNPNGA